MFLLVSFSAVMFFFSAFSQGRHQPGKVRELDSAQAKVGESGKSQGKCVLPVVCYHRISILNSASTRLTMQK